MEKKEYSDLFDDQILIRLFIYGIRIRILLLGILKIITKNCPGLFLKLFWPVILAKRTGRDYPAGAIFI